MLQPLIEDAATDAVGECDVRAYVELEPTVRPLRSGGSARINDIQLCSPSDRLQDVVKEDRMRLAGIAPPEDDEVRLLNLAVGSRPPSCPKDRRQTGDARGMSSSVAAVDVVAANGSADELLGCEIHLVGSLGTAKHSEGGWTMSLHGGANAGSGTVQRLFPKWRYAACRLHGQEVRSGEAETYCKCTA